MKLTSITPTGRKSSTTVSDDVFGVTGQKAQRLLSQAVKVYQSRRRQGTARTKTRSDINLTKRKWYRQKGTGRARHGAQSAPLFVGGGVAHGPTGIANWQLKLSHRQKQAALKAALSLQAERTMVLDAIDELPGKTAAAAKLLATTAPNSRRTLVVIDQPNDDVIRSLRNLAGVELTAASQLNALQVIAAEAVIFTKKSLAVLEDRLGATAAAPATTSAAAANKTTSSKTKTSKSSKTKATKS